MSLSKYSWMSLAVQLHANITSRSQAEILRTSFNGLNHICASFCKISAQQKRRQIGKDFDLNISGLHALSLNPTRPAAPKQLSYCPKLPKLMTCICCTIAANALMAPPTYCRSGFWYTTEHLLTDSSSSERGGHFLAHQSHHRAQRQLLHPCQTQCTWRLHQSGQTCPSSASHAAEWLCSELLCTPGGDPEQWLHRSHSPSRGPAPACHSSMLPASK